MVRQLVEVVVVAVLAGWAAAKPGCYSCSYSSHSSPPGKSGHSGHPEKFGHSGSSGHPGNFGHSGHASFGNVGRPGGNGFGSAGALAQAGSFAFSSSSSFSNAQSYANSHANSHALSFANSHAPNQGLNQGPSHGGNKGGSGRGRHQGGRPNIGHPTGCPNCGCGGCGGSCGWCGGNYGRKKRSIDGLMNSTNVQSLYDAISSEDKDQCGLRLVCELAQRDPRDLAEDEVQILLPYRGAGESDGSMYGQYDEAAWHGQEGHACPEHYPLCAFTAQQIMDEYRKGVAASANEN
ncbi:uncharacterized PE-PGRS family protein PE_PGRS20-like [Eriocheir sinensis]|uniref:uncharacterized PE-PGRS family protein PE_PGRS20-like n=1 Tax=Eriocheir sinensis TaxID=95602 RepID=UPI0021C66370|nr:uncharacterized PE-PGRS family protein PE_PGRS20-like [Eriocheir sinensis]